VKDMLDLLSTEPIGQILLCNMVDALEDGALDKAYMADFLRCCRDAHQKLPATSVADLVGLVADTAMTSAPLGASAGETFLLGCSTPVVFVKR
jgi:hypothetical protein